MSASKRKKAVQLALQNSTAPISVYRATQKLSEKLPNAFWEIEYVLGYLLSIADGAIDSVGVKDTTDKGRVIHEFLSTISNNKISTDQIVEAATNPTEEQLEGAKDAMQDIIDVKNNESRGMTRLQQKLLALTD